MTCEEAERLARQIDAAGWHTELREDLKGEWAVFVWQGDLDAEEADGYLVYSIRQWHDILLSLAEEARDGVGGEHLPPHTPSRDDLPF